MHETSLMSEPRKAASNETPEKVFFSLRWKLLRDDLVALLEALETLGRDERLSADGHHLLLGLLRNRMKRAPAAGVPDKFKHFRQLEFSALASFESSISAILDVPDATSALLRVYHPIHVRTAQEKISRAVKVLDRLIELPGGTLADARDGEVNREGTSGTTEPIDRVLLPFMPLLDGLGLRLQVLGKNRESGTGSPNASAATEPRPVSSSVEGKSEPDSQLQPTLMIKGLVRAYRRALLSGRRASVDRVVQEATTLLDEDDLSVLRRELIIAGLAIHISRRIGELATDDRHKH